MMNYGVMQSWTVTPIAVLALLWSSAGGAEPVRVTEILDGDTIVLAGGETVRLAGIAAPKPPLRRDAGRDYPLAEQATAALTLLLAGRAVELRAAGPADRHRRIVAHLWREDGIWAEGELLRRGLARVHTTADDRDFTREMLAIEDEARRAKRGLWRLAAFAVRDAATVTPAEGFHLVEGAIAAPSKVKGDVYLNFGADWRTDFTVLIPRKSLRLFREARLDPLSLTGQRVRVRGWVFARNGPMIEATHPEQIELLDASSPLAAEEGARANAREGDGAVAR
jgi:micrococcal nuclease